MAKKQSTALRGPAAAVSLMRRKVSPRFVMDITQHIIDAAVPKDSGHCMVADALKAALPEATSISVDLQTIRFSDPARGLRYIYLTPPDAQEALIMFDEGHKPSPFRCQVARAIQIVSMFRRNSYGTAVKVHDLGRKHIQPEGKHARPTVIGGKPPPVACERTENKSAAGTENKLAVRADGGRLRGRPRRRREFGLRAFKIGSPLTGSA